MFQIRYALVLFVLAGLSNLPALAGDDKEEVAEKCATPYDAEQAAVDERDFLNRLRSLRPGDAAVMDAPRVVPVYFHIIQTTSRPDGDVTQKMIDDQMTVLNQAFAPSKISFNLVNVIRTTNDRWARITFGKIENEMKTALHQGGMESMNVYIGRIESGVAGWALLPRGGAQNVALDGVVISNTTLPDGKTSGEVLVHEAGHWAGLFHTFDGGCSAAGDRVDDTPAEKSPAPGCSGKRDSCKGGGLDPVHNYMDYSGGACWTEFTPGQTVRMHQKLNLYR